MLDDLSHRNEIIMRYCKNFAYPQIKAVNINDLVYVGDRLNRNSNTLNGLTLNILHSHL